MVGYSFQSNNNNNNNNNNYNNNNNNSNNNNNNKFLKFDFFVTKFVNPTLFMLF